MSGNQAALVGVSRPPTLLVNSSGTPAPLAYLAVASKLNLKAISSGALSAGVLKSLYSVTGSGVLAVCCARAKDATSRTIRIKIIIDGVDVHDPGASSAISAGDIGVVAVGTPVLIATANPDYAIIPTPLVFNSSLDIQVASSLGETDKVELDLYAWTT